MDRSKLIKKLIGELLPPGAYARLAEEEAEKLAAKKASEWKQGEPYRTIAEPKITDINPQFRDTYIENLKREAAAKPTPENQQRLQTAIDDLLPKLESAPKSPEEIAAMRRLEEFAPELGPKPKVLTREQMREKRELDKIIEEINADKGPAEKTKLMDPSSKTTTKILPVLGLTGAGALASSFSPDEAEAGVKGSLVPRKQLADKFKKTINGWVSGGRTSERDILSNILDEDQTGLVRKEMLRRLSKEGKIRFNPEFNEHSVRLYRGDNEDFFNKGLYKTQSTSWTPDISVADSFKHAIEDSSGNISGNIYQVDLPVSKIGAYLNSLPGNRGFRSEKEVIVKPFEGKVEKKSTFDDDDPSNLLELINKRITQKTPISDLTKPTYGTRPDAEEKKDLAKNYAQLTNQGYKFLNKNIPYITPGLSNEDVLAFIQKTGSSTNLLENLANLPYSEAGFLSPEHKVFLKEKASEIENPTDFILNKIVNKKQFDEPFKKSIQKQDFMNQIESLYYSGAINRDERKLLKDKIIIEFRDKEFGDTKALIDTYKTYLENFKNEESSTVEALVKYTNLKDYLHGMHMDTKITTDEYHALEDILDEHFDKFSEKHRSLSPNFSPELMGIAGAGALASSSSAEAADTSTVSQSNPEYTSSTTSSKLKEAASEQQEKSKLLSALEGYGTAARSGVSSATLGLSEPVVSGLNAAVGSLVSAGFDAENALDFIKKAADPERLKKEYQSDVEYRKKMQEEHPIADIGGSLAGAFSPVGPAAKLAGAIGKGTAKAGEALYKAGTLKKLGGVVGAPAARSIMKTGLAAGEGAAFIPAVSLPEQKIKEASGFSESSESSVFPELNEPSAFDEAESGAKIQGGVKGGFELAKFLKRFRR